MQSTEPPYPYYWRAARRSSTQNITNFNYKKLLEQGLKLAWGIEDEHNLPFQILRKYAEKYFPHQTFDWKKLEQCSNEQKESLYVPASFGARKGLSEISRLFRNQYLYEKGISTHFNDAAWRNEDGKWFLDPDDPDTLAEIRRTLRTKIDPYEGLGMSIRDTLMAKKTLKHLKSSKAEIYILQCGNCHIGKLLSLLSNTYKNVQAIPVFNKPPHGLITRPSEQLFKNIIQGGKSFDYKKLENPYSAENQYIKNILLHLEWGEDVSPSFDQNFVQSHWGKHKKHFEKMLEECSI